MATTYFQKIAFTLACLVAATGALAANPGYVVVSRNLDRWWLPAPHHSKIPPKYPLFARKHGVAGCVAVAYAIDRNGQVTDAHIWRERLSDLQERKEVEQAALHAISQWRFVPASGNTAHKPVYTYIIDTFSLRNRRWSPERQQIERRRLRDQCSIPNFVQQVHAAGTLPAKRTSNQS